MSGSILNAPPVKEVYVVWGGYGTINGTRTIPKGRLWVLAETADPDARLVVRVAFNDPQTGNVVYEDPGEASFVKIRTNKWAEVVLPNGRKVTQVLAPCVCGAGAVAYAGPLTGRHHLTALSPASHERVTVIS